MTDHTRVIPCAHCGTTLVLTFNPENTGAWVTIRDEWTGEHHACYRKPRRR